MSWRYKQPQNCICDDVGNVIADLWDNDFELDEDAEHGQLLAASPDLLAACETAEQVYEHLIGITPADAMPASNLILTDKLRELRAAILKAKGGGS